MGLLRRLLMQAWKIAPAIAMGCTMVMKLSEKTPLSGLMMCHLFKEGRWVLYNDRKVAVSESTPIDLGYSAQRPPLLPGRLQRAPARAGRLQ